MDANEDDAKPPAKKVNNLDKVTAVSTKCKIDYVLHGTGTLSMDGTANEEDDDVKQLAKMNKQLGYSLESASRISKMTSGSGPNLPIQPFPSVQGTGSWQQPVPIGKYWLHLPKRNLVHSKMLLHGTRMRRKSVLCLTITPGRPC